MTVTGGAKIPRSIVASGPGDRGNVSIRDWPESSERGVQKMLRRTVGPRIPGEFYQYPLDHTLDRVLGIQKLLAEICLRLFREKGYPLPGRSVVNGKSRLRALMWNGKS